MEAQRCSFLTLPAELRQVVYRHIIVLTLATGFPSNMWGFYLSCRFIRQEMESEIDPKACKMLHFQSCWNSLIEGYAPLRIDVPWFGDGKFLPDDLTIHIPVCKAWNPRIIIADDYSSHDPTNTLLNELLGLRVSVLTISFGHLRLEDAHSSKDNPRMMTGLIHRVRRLARGRLAFSQVDRLLVQIGYVGNHDSIIVIQEQSARLMSLYLDIPVKRVWLASDGAASKPNWLFGFDFKDGLLPISGEFEEKSTRQLTGQC